MHTLTNLLWIITNFGTSVFILYSFTLLGHRIRQVLPVAEWSFALSVLWEVYLGITAAAIFITTLGMLGFFNLFVFVVLLASGPLLNIHNTDALLSPWRALYDLANSLRDHKLVGLVLGAITVMLFIPTAAPEIFYDALYYHLGLPQQYLLAGKIQWFPHVVHSAFPAYLDMLFGLCLGLSDAGAAKFFNLLLFLLACCATAALVDEVIGQPRVALAGALTVATVPGVVVMSTMCAIDTALIGFAAMSALAIARMQRADASNMTGLVFLAAVTAGFSAGSKYTGLWLLAVFAGAVIMQPGLRSPGRKTLLFVCLAFLIAAPWYTRNLMATGDPVYPAIKSALGDQDAGWAMERLKRDVQTLGLSWSAPISLIIGLVHTPENFGAGAEPGVLVPIGTVALMAGAVGVPFLRPWAVALGVYFLIWMSTTGVVRYLYPMYPLCALGVAWLVNEAFERRDRSLLGTVTLVLLAMVPLSKSVRVIDRVYAGTDLTALVSGAMSRDDYLARRLAYYPAAQWLNTHAPADARVFYLGETRLLYLERAVQFSSAYDTTEIGRLLEPDTPPFFTQLRSRGISHILLHGREIERLRASYNYLSLPADAERRLRQALQECRIVFRQAGVQICELPRQT